MYKVPAEGKEHDYLEKHKSNNEPNMNVSKSDGKILGFTAVFL